jgi:hypothetical protein
MILGTRTGVGQITNVRCRNLVSRVGVIPKARAFTSGPRDLAWSESGAISRKIPCSASLRSPPVKSRGSTSSGHSIRCNENEKGVPPRVEYVLEAQALKEARDDPRWRRSSPEILLHDGVGSKRQSGAGGSGHQRARRATEVFSAVSGTAGAAAESGQTLCALSTNRSLSASPQKSLWTGTLVFIEG